MVFLTALGDTKKSEKNKRDERPACGRNLVMPIFSGVRFATQLPSGLPASRHPYLSLSFLLSLCCHLLGRIVVHVVLCTTRKQSTRPLVGSMRD